MKKYRVRAYYTYMIEVEVDAEDINDAYEKGRDKAMAAPNSHLEYIDEQEVEVAPYDSQGRIDYDELETF